MQRPLLQLIYIKLPALHVIVNLVILDYERRLRVFGHVALAHPKAEQDHHRVIGALLRSPSRWKRPCGHPGWRGSMLTHIDLSKSIQFSSCVYFRLQCRYHAEPEARIMWLCNGAQLFASEHVSLSGSADQSTLTIHGATLLDTGEYVCSASNTLGQATTKTFLRVRSKSA